jgi:hypothetical protein
MTAAPVKKATLAWHGSEEEGGAEHPDWMGRFPSCLALLGE